MAGQDKEGSTAMTMAVIGTVLVTGAQGNLGRKLVAHLVASSWCERVIGVDRAIGQDATGEGRVRWIACDLADPRDDRWRDAVAEAEAVVHLAARNPYPDAPWEDAVLSFDMTANVLYAAAHSGVRRFVFASSNHVMGQYKDPPLSDRIAPGRLTTALPLGPGTRWFNGRSVVQGTAYATSKLMGERACAAVAESSDTLTSVSIRVGWCQPGENRPDTINTSGLPGEEGATGPDAERDLRWFRSMWLSNRDYAQVMECALRADATPWDARAVVVNGMSANRAMPWDIGLTTRLIGYEPKDDIAKALAT
jgi:NAD(P)-dependent dehydrogenase (short-subunit alcohol dehydrogenase family)